MAEPPAKRRREEPTDLKIQLQQSAEKFTKNIQSFRRPLKPTTDSRAATVALLHQVTDLKRVVRNSFERAHLATTKTLDETQHLDQLHLQLQNILYEKIHVEKEIQRCEQFRSRHEDIALDGEDDPTITDPHKQMLYHLDKELQERKRLQIKFQQLKEEKRLIIESNISKREKLAQLPLQLNAVLKAAQPLKQYLASVNDKGQITQNSAAAYLPPPMYTLYMFLLEYRKVHDDIAVEVTGDKVAAKYPATVSEWEPQEKDEMEDIDDDGDDEEHMKHDDDDDSRRSKTVKVGIEKESKILQLHPLQIHLTFKCQATNVSIEFAYLTQLQTVTVINKSSSLSSVDVLSCLYPDDVGNELASVGAIMLAEAQGIMSFVEHVGKCGRPYRWAQVIAGIVDTNLNADTVAKRTAHRSLVQVLDRIRDTVTALASLQTQLVALRSCSIVVDASAADLFPRVSTAKLSSWTKMDSLSSDIESVFEAKFKRDDLELLATVRVSMVYPLVSPKISLMLSSSSSSSSSSPSAAVGESINLRAMEREVNVFQDELYETAKIDENLLLTNQMRRLQMCFDVFCDTNTTPVCANEQMYDRTRRGRDRLRPFRYVAENNKFEHR